MAKRYARMTAATLRAWWKARLGDGDILEGEELVNLSERLTDLVFIETHARLGLVFELAANYQRVLSSWRSTRRVAASVGPSYKPASWLNLSVSAVLAGECDPNPGEGAGIVLAGLLDVREGSPTPQTMHKTMNPSERHLIPKKERRRRQRHERRQLNLSIAPQYTAKQRVPDHHFGRDKEAVDAIYPTVASRDTSPSNPMGTDTKDPFAQVAAFAFFVGSNVHFLAYRPDETIPLARNRAASGLVTERAEKLLCQLDHLWIARDPRPLTEQDSSCLMRTLLGHTENVLAAALSADGSLVVSGSEDRTIRVWDVSSGGCVHVLEGHRAPVERLAITPDGTRAVSCAREHGRDVSWRIWDLDTGICLRQGGVEDEIIDSLAVSADGKMVVSLGSHACLRVWDATWGTLVRTIRSTGHVPEGSLAITPDGKLGYTAAGEDVVIWDLGHGRVLRALVGHRHIVNAVACSADGKVIASAGQDDAIRLWDAMTGRCLRVVVTPRDGIPSGLKIQGCEGIKHLCLSWDGRVAGAVSADSKHVRFWDLASGECNCILREDGSSANCLATTATGKVAVTASSENLRVWDIGSSAPATSLPRYAGQVRKVASSRDGALVVALGDDSPLAFWDGVTGELRETCRWKRANGYMINIPDIALSCDGEMLVCTVDNTLQVVNTRNNYSTRELAGHELPVQRVCLSPCDDLVIAGDEDRMSFAYDSRNYLSCVSVWDLRNGRWLRRLNLRSASPRLHFCWIS